MAETFDDEIIDLTDLMEEGDAAKKRVEPETKVVEKTKLLEPESFDLGKEIALDDELTIDTSSGPEESVELIPQPPAEPAQAPVEFIEAEPPREPLKSIDDFDSLIREPTPKPAPEPDLSVPEDFALEEPQPREERPPIMKSRSPASVSPVFDAFFQETVEEVKIEAGLGLSEPIKPQKIMEAVETPVPLETSAAEIPMPPSEMAEPEAPSAAPEPLIEVEATVPPEPVITPVTSVASQPSVSHAEPGLVRQEVEAQVQAAAAELREEVPALLEGIIRPVMADLIREITQTTRDIIPGIVEKIIREEIDKLKKLD